MRAAMIVALVIIVTIISSQRHLTLELWVPGHFQSLDEGIYLGVAMTPTLSQAETCSNQEQGQS